MRWDWYVSKGFSIERSLYKKLTGKQLKSKRYANGFVLNENEGSIELQRLIHSGSPFMACRYGHVEIETMAAVYEFLQSGKESSLDKVISKGNIFYNAGFFPNKRELVVKFGKLMLECSKSIDMIGVWYIPFEDYFISHYAAGAKMTFLRTYEPWNEIDPWTKELAGKKVLVVHPFDKTIRKQYERREMLFENKEILPSFELITYPAVQTIAGNVDTRFETWFDALEMMFQDCLKIDFDIAILGCGAYGMPLAYKLKNVGKQAVHMGGATQLLFGIKGKRWDSHPIVSKLYNEYWVRPDHTEVPQNAQRVENRCYW